MTSAKLSKTADCNNRSFLQLSTFVTTASVPQGYKAIVVVFYGAFSDQIRLISTTDRDIVFHSVSEAIRHVFVLPALA
jgi:hypothetical protein